MLGLLEENKNSWALIMGKWIRINIKHLKSQGKRLLFKILVLVKSVEIFKINVCSYFFNQILNIINIFFKFKYKYVL